MRILLVEDDLALHDAIEQSLISLGHRVDGARRVDEAKHWWRVQSFDAVLLDLNLPDGSGLSVLRDARMRGDKTPVIVLTALEDLDLRVALRRYVEDLKATAEAISEELTQDLALMSAAAPREARAATPRRAVLSRPVMPQASAIC